MMRTVQTQHHIAPQIAHLAVPLADLHPFPGNPRQGDIGAICQSLEFHGQFRPLVVNKRDNVVLAGNHTMAAMRALGWDQAAVTYVDVDEGQAARIVLADNRTNDLATYSDQHLADLLQSLPDLDGTGYDSEALDALLADLDGAGPSGVQGDPDAVPAQPVEPRTQRGDIWALGPHRLLCGDATCPDALTTLMEGARADVLWTDPPYGVDYTGKTKEALTLAGDQEHGLEALLEAALAAAQTVLHEGAAFYITHPPGALSMVFWQTVASLGWRCSQGLVWVKDTMVLGHADYHYKHEPILFGYLPGPGRRGRGGEGWYGDNAQTSVFDVARPSASREHPTTKPVDLIVQHLRNSCPPHGVVLDIFAGAGSTMAAAQLTGHSARLLEIDPRYCDVIVQRWQDLTGQTAIRAGDKSAMRVAQGD